MKKTEIKNIIKKYLLENKTESEIKEIFESEYINIYNRIMEFNNLNYENGFLRNSYNFLHKTDGRKCKNCQRSTDFINFFDGYKIFCENKDCKLERIKIKKEKIAINNEKRKINYSSIENEKQYSFEEEKNIIGKMLKINKLIFEKKYKSIFKNIKKYIELKKIENKNFNEEVFLYINQIIPNKCKNCGKDTKYNKKEKKYKEYCSIECYQKSYQFKIDRKEGIKNINWEKRNQKYKETCINKYGVDNPLKNKEIINKIKNTVGNKKSYLLEITKNKIKVTNVLKYGFINPLKNKLISEKVRQSLLNKTDEEKNEIINKKIKTSLGKYGVKHPNQNDEIRNKMTLALKKKNYANIIFEIEKSNFFQDFNFEKYLNDGYKQEVDLICKKCKKNYKDYLAYNRLPKCPFCNPINKSKGESEVIEYIKTFYKKEIYVNNRKEIKPYELDLYIPTEKFAIEYNGILYHSFGKGSSKFDNSKIESSFYKKHLMKTELCEKQGVHLFHIFENEWAYDEKKKEVWQSIISNKLGKVSNKIFARKCIVKEVGSSEKNEFLENNHLQGKDNSRVKLGLYYEEELVQIMTFGASRYNKNINWEMHRFATKKNMIIVGGASKLFKYFEKNYLLKGERIITYADRRHSQGKIYEKLGFSFSHNSRPNFFYFKLRDKILYSRQRFQKHKLQLELEKYDEKLSANENMFNNGYRRIWDCGNKVYIYEKK